MPGEFNVSLGTAGTGLTVYAVVFDSEWNGTESTIASGNVWTGSAFVADSFPNRSLGAIALTESPAGSGTYIGNAPSTLPTGNYQFLEYSRLGVTPNAATDTQLLLSASQFSVISATGLNPVSFTFDPTTPFFGDAQSMSMNLGSGTIFQIVPTASAVLDNADWEFRIGTKKYGISCVFNVAASNMVISPTGTITINPTVAQTTVLPTDQPVYGELWRVGPADDNIDCFARVLITIIDVLV